GQDSRRLARAGVDGFRRSNVRQRQEAGRHQRVAGRVPQLRPQRLAGCVDSGQPHRRLCADHCRRAVPPGSLLGGFGMTDVYAIGELAQFCESPIEVRLVEALAEAFTGLEEAGMILDGLAPCAYEAYRNLSAGHAAAYLIPQAEIE